MADYYATVSGASAKNGNAWNQAFGLAELQTALNDGTISPGDTVWIEDGTYSLTANIDILDDGTATDPITLIGVKSGTTNEPADYSDYSMDAADKPLFSQGTYYFRTGDYAMLRNLEFEGSATYTVYIDDYTKIENCKVTNTYGSTSSRYCVDCGSHVSLINNEFTTTNTRCIDLGSNSRVLFNYFHDMTNGSYGQALDYATYVFVCGNIFDNCRIGCDVGGNTKHTTINNTFYDGTTALHLTYSSMGVYINNLIDSTSSYGFDQSSQRDSNLFWHNWGDDTRNNDMWLNIPTANTSPYADHPNNQDSLAGDPSFTTAGSDFSLADGSSCLGDGFGISKGVG